MGTNNGTIGTVFHIYMTLQLKRGRLTPPGLLSFYWNVVLSSVKYLFLTRYNDKGGGTFGVGNGTAMGQSGKSTVPLENTQNKIRDL